MVVMEGGERAWYGGNAGLSSSPHTGIQYSSSRICCVVLLINIERPFHLLYACLCSFTAKKQYTENSKQIFPGKELQTCSANSNIHVSVSDLFIPLVGLPSLLQENRWAECGQGEYIDRSQTHECGN